MVAVETRRISIAQDPDVVSGIHVMLDCVPEEVQKSAGMFAWFRICSRQWYP